MANGLIENSREGLVATISQHDDTGEVIGQPSVSLVGSTQIGELSRLASRGRSDHFGSRRRRDAFLPAFCDKDRSCAPDDRLFGVSVRPRPAAVFLQRAAMSTVTVFDPETVADRATFEMPTTPAAGIEHVFVNRRPVWREGNPTGERPGRALRRQLMQAAAR